MTQEFVTYEQALALKELGFDERCMGHYWEGLFYYQTTHSHPSTMPNSIESCSAPLYQQVFRWFREKYGMLGVVNVAPQGFYYYDINKIDKYKEINQDVDFDSFEEAEDECINHIIKLINKIV